VSSQSTLRRRLLGVGLSALCSFAPARAAEPLSDPTRPHEAARADVVPAAKAGDDNHQMHAIFHADDRRIAVINGVRVRESDPIGGARVLAIEADRVRLQRGTEIVELELVSPAFKNARLADVRPGEPAVAAERSQTTDPRGGSR